MYIYGCGTLSKLAVSFTGPQKSSYSLLKIIICFSELIVTADIWYWKVLMWQAIMTNGATLESVDLPSYAR